MNLADLHFGKTKRFFEERYVERSQPSRQVEWSLKEGLFEDLRLYSALPACGFFHILIRRQRKRCQKRSQGEVFPQELDSATRSFSDLFHLWKKIISFEKTMKLVVFKFPDRSL